MSSLVPSKARVAITGYGVVSPLANTAPESFAALVAGQSGIGRISHFDPEAITSHVAGEVKNFDFATTGLEPKDARKTDRFIQLGLAATREAMAMAGLLEARSLPKPVRERFGVMLGTGIGGLSTIEENIAVMAEKGPRRLSPFFIPAMLPNLLAGQASIQYGLQGPSVCPVSACATSAHALGWAKRLIEWHEADIVVAGGAEAAVTPAAVGGFAAMRALSSSFNQTPQQASRPFDQGRDGFVIAEGAAVMVLEREDHAKARGAPILGYLAGFGQSSDASHLTLPAEQGEGAQRAMNLALADANLAPADIGYVNAHATSTPAGDETEAAAISTVFAGNQNLAVSATKGATGHLLGGAGALEAVFTLQTLREKILPPTLNLTTPSEGIALDLVPLTSRPYTGQPAALSNSFGFGGTNAALVVTL